MFQESVRNDLISPTGAGIDQDGSTACLLQGKGGVTSGPRPLLTLLHSALILFWILLFS